jgi:ABC-type protease/lipase transport system fused ATPase/permease subunit
VDQILMLADGQAALCGPRDEVLAALAQSQQRPAAAPAPSAQAQPRSAPAVTPLRLGPASSNPPRF